jgi:hypothetical protein
MARQLSFTLHPVVITRLTALAVLLVFVGAYLYLIFSEKIVITPERPRNYNAKVVQIETAQGGVFLQVAGLSVPVVQQQPGASDLGTGQGVTAPITYVPSDLGKRDLTRIEE